MGKFMDMLPQIQADIRMRISHYAITRSLGCSERNCSIQGWESPVDFATVVVHNGEQHRFEIPIARSLHDFAGPVFDHGSLEPVAWVPQVIVEWITERHAAADARRETDWQAEIDADGWLLHAEMVGGLA